MAYGVDQSKVLAKAIADFVSVGARLAKGNFLSFFSLIGPFSELKNVDFTALKAELLDLNADERAIVEQAFSSALDFDDKVLQQKITDAADTIDKAVDLIENGVKTVNDAIALLNKFKAILGV